MSRVSGVAASAPESGVGVQEWFWGLSESEVALTCAWLENPRWRWSGRVDRVVENCVQRRKRWMAPGVLFDEPADILLSELCALVDLAREGGGVGEVVVGLARSWTGSVADLVACAERLAACV